MRFLILVLAFAVLAMAQQPQQPTPQQTCTATVTALTQAESQAVVIINQVPEMVAKIEAQQKQIVDLQKELDALKAAQKKEKK